MNSDLSFRLVSVDRKKPVHDHDADQVTVTYAVKRTGEHTREWLLPVALMPECIEDHDLTKVARSYLANMFEALAAETADWKISTEWFEQNVRDNPEASKRRLG